MGVLLALAAASPAGAQFGGMPPPPKAQARREDIPYIKCQVCELLAKHAYKHVKELMKGSTPSKRVRRRAGSSGHRRPLSGAAMQAAMFSRASGWAAWLACRYEHQQQHVLLVQHLSPLLQRSRPPAWCGMSPNVRAHVAARTRCFAPAQVDELAVIEAMEKITNPTSREGEWLTKLDVGEAAGRLVLVEMGDLGQCDEVCRTAELAAQAIVGEHDTDMAEVLYVGRKGRAQFNNWLCYELSGVCKSKPPRVPPGRLPSPPFKPKSKSEVDAERMMETLKAQGLGGQVYNRDEMLARAKDFEAEEGGEDGELWGLGGGRAQEERAGLGPGRCQRTGGADVVWGNGAGVSCAAALGLLPARPSPCCSAAPVIHAGDVPAEASNDEL